MTDLFGPLWSSGPALPPSDSLHCEKQRAPGPLPTKRSGPDFGREWSHPAFPVTDRCPPVHVHRAPVAAAGTGTQDLPDAARAPGPSLRRGRLCRPGRRDGRTRPRRRRARREPDRGRRPERSGRPWSAPGRPRADVAASPTAREEGLRGGDVSATSSSACGSHHRSSQKRHDPSPGRPGSFACHTRTVTGYGERKRTPAGSDFSPVVRIERSTDARAAATSLRFRWTCRTRRSECLMKSLQDR